MFRSRDGICRIRCIDGCVYCGKQEIAAEVKLKKYAHILLPHCACVGMSMVVLGLIRDNTVLINAKIETAVAKQIFSKRRTTSRLRCSRPWRCHECRRKNSVRIECRQMSALPRRKRIVLGQNNLQNNSKMNMDMKAAVGEEAGGHRAQRKACQ